ncbi:MAG: hypothetical protein QGH60_02205 [Phycisphaerae bacterium]|jgi:hypothetical protein|nr:hypothetical protein [Phycisphaerae bacterium]
MVERSTILACFAFALASALASAADGPVDGLIGDLSKDDTAPAPDESQKVVHRTAVDKTGVRTTDITLSNTAQKAIPINGAILGRWVFEISSARKAQKYRPLVWRNAQWYGSTYWMGPDWTRVGKDWHHPGTNTPSVRCFRAPAAGRITITGRIYKADTGGGDGVNLFVRHNAETLWTGQIAAKDTKGLEPKLTLTVAKGDAIRFVVHKRGAIPFDTTHWDPIITYASGKIYQASKGFVAGKGKSDWSCEMQMDAGRKMGLPRVHAFGGDLALLDAAPLESKAVTLSQERGHLPGFIIADGTNESGVVFAVSPKSFWQFDVVRTKSGNLDVTLVLEGIKRKLEAGGSMKAPRVVMAPYRGGWRTGVKRLDQLLSARKEIAVSFADAHARMSGAATDRSELQLWTMLQLDWKRQDGTDLKTATKKHLALARKLLDDLRIDRPKNFLAAEAKLLDQLTENDYLRVRWLKRHIALSNPLMDFGELLFCKRAPTSYSHLVMQYFGWRARAGGGLFVLKNPGHSLAVRDIFDGKLESGNVLAPRLNYDAKKIVFSFVPCDDKTPVAERYYNICEAAIDPKTAYASGAKSLRRLTSGPYEHLMPTYLPDGGIAFSSTRRRGYSRCFGGQFGTKWHVYTIHRMGADGRNLTTLSYHDTNEWFPAVANDGRILYSRWDYIDRDAVTHQNLWSMRPDGTNPLAVWGNATPKPHCTFQIQPIPNSNKIAFTASAHHSITAGSIVVVDPSIARDGMEALTRITPEVPFPEAEGRAIREYYAAPWPLSEKYFLTAYSPVPLVWEPGANPVNALGLYLIDSFGNRELIYRDPEISSTNPCPLRPRKRPQLVTGNLPKNPPQTGEVMMRDVYRGLGKIKRGTVKQLRIVQILPKTTNLNDRPAVGLAQEENARAILGTIPVEADGSARFIVPACKPILFQALDANGLAVQTMRSLTYLQPGESVSCIGCHEPFDSVPATGRTIAMKRKASQIDPGKFGGETFSFMRLVQPVLDKHCVECHPGTKTKKNIDLTSTPLRNFTRSYWSLCGDRNFWGTRTNPKNAREALVPRFGARNIIQITPPGGMYGSPGSRLIKLLRDPKGHYKVKLSGDNIRRIAAWIDCNATFYGVYDPKAQAQQLKGLKVPMPEIQ